MREADNNPHAGRITDGERSAAPLVWERLCRAGAMRGWQRPPSAGPAVFLSRLTQLAHLSPQLLHLADQLIEPSLNGRRLPRQRGAQFALDTQFEESGFDLAQVLPQGVQFLEQ